MRGAGFFFFFFGFEYGFDCLGGGDGDEMGFDRGLNQVEDGKW